MYYVCACVCMCTSVCCMGCVHLCKCARACLCIFVGQSAEGRRAALHAVPLLRLETAHAALDAVAAAQLVSALQVRRR